MSERICVAITGASGSPYALRLIEVLLAAGRAVDVIVSKAAQLVVATETALALPGNPRAQAETLQRLFEVDEQRLRVFGREDWMAPWASRFRPAGAGGDLPLQHRHAVSHCLRCQQ